MQLCYCVVYENLIIEVTYHNIKTNLATYFNNYALA